MNRTCLLGISLAIVFSLALFNHVTLSYGADTYHPDCKTARKPTPVDCTYQCTCECCPGVDTNTGVTRLGYQDFNCKTYTKVADYDWKGPLTIGPATIGTNQPLKVPYYPFNSGFANYSTTATCVQGSDKACCVKNCIENYGTGEKAEYDEWGEFDGWSDNCKTYLYEPGLDGSIHKVENDWSSKELPNEYHCTPDYYTLPLDPLITLRCEYKKAIFDRRCNVYYTDPLVAGALDDCEIKTTEPDCPDCAAFCATQPACP